MKGVREIDELWHTFQRDFAKAMGLFPNYQDELVALYRDISSYWRFIRKSLTSWFEDDGVPLSLLVDVPDPRDEIITEKIPIFDGLSTLPDKPRGMRLPPYVDETLLWPVCPHSGPTIQLWECTAPSAAHLLRNLFEAFRVAIKTAHDRAVTGECSIDMRGTWVANPQGDIPELQIFEDGKLVP